MTILTFKRVNDWIGFLEILKFSESDLREIRAEGKFTNKNGSSFAYVYRSDYPCEDFREDMKIGVDIQRRLPQSHPAFEKFQFPNGAIFPYSVVRPPFRTPEYLEFDLSGKPKTLQDFWTGFGSQARHAGYNLQRLNIGLIPEYTGSHILIEKETAEIREHPFFTSERIAKLADSYPNADTK